MTNNNPSRQDERVRLLAQLPVSDHKMELAGVSTAVLVGGDGPPLILLHGPGEPAVWWMRVIPELTKTHRVIAPDMPGHGASDAPDDPLDANRMTAWLDALIERTCESAPVLVGHASGGAVAARYAIAHGERIDRLVLVDSLGLGRFFPSLRFAFQMIRFMGNPTEARYDRFLSQCMYDPSGLRQGMGDLWEPFLSYYLQGMRSPEQKGALQSLMKQVAIPKIPPTELSRIDVPTALIWGRHDRAVKMGVAQAASKRHGWPLHVIENARDDPKLEQPEAFLRVLYEILGAVGDSGMAKHGDRRDPISTPIQQAR